MGTTYHSRNSLQLHRQNSTSSTTVCTQWAVNWTWATNHKNNSWPSRPVYLTLAPFNTQLKFGILYKYIWLIFLNSKQHSESFTAVEGHLIPPAMSWIRLCPLHFCPLSCWACELIKGTLCIQQGIWDLSVVDNQKKNWELSIRLTENNRLLMRMIPMLILISWEGN